MKKTGFTLIELLAVIVILAIITLIATPIVINIINDAKKSGEKESIKIYLDVVAKTIARKQFANTSFNPGKCNVKKNKKIKCGTEEIEIDIKGEVPEEGTIKFSKGMVISGVNLKLNGLYYQVKNGEVSDGTIEKIKKYSNYITLIDDVAPSGLSPGDEYTYEVMDNMEEPYTFYILSIEGKQVNLIQDRNICGYQNVNDARNGKLADKDNLCLIPWYNERDDNSNGAITVMQGIYNATKKWSNVPNMNLSYWDEGNKANSNYGYGKIETTEAGIKITKKDGITEVTRSGNQTPVIPYEASKPLKARLPKLEEVYNSGTDDNHCHNNNESCPNWLTNGLMQYSTYYPNNTHIEGIYGYWLMSSYPGDYSFAYRVDCTGRADLYTYVSTSGLGIRAVITVSVDDLS